jgi:hypothetical protein
MIVLDPVALLRVDGSLQASIAVSPVTCMGFMTIKDGNG